MQHLMRHSRLEVLHGHYCKIAATHREWHYVVNARAPRRIINAIARRTTVKSKLLIAGLLVVGFAGTARRRRRMWRARKQSRDPASVAQIRRGTRVEC